MNYQKHYGLLIEKARSQNRIKGNGVYYESHHILPKCMGGKLNDENLVSLTAREHFSAHILLPKIYPEKTSLVIALVRMKTSKYLEQYLKEYKEKHPNTNLSKINNRLYEFVRKKSGEYSSKLFSDYVWIHNDSLRKNKRVNPNQLFPAGYVKGFFNFDIYFKLKDKAQKFKTEFIRKNVSINDLLVSENPKIINEILDILEEVDLDFLEEITNTRNKQGKLKWTWGINEISFKSRRFISSVNFPKGWKKGRGQIKKTIFVNRKTKNKKIRRVPNLKDVDSLFFLILYEKFKKCGHDSVKEFLKDTNCDKSSREVLRIWKNIVPDFIIPKIRSGKKWIYNIETLERKQILSIKGLPLGWKFGYFYK